MKRLLYWMLCLALLAGCSKDKSMDEPDEPIVFMLVLSNSELVFEAEGGEKTFTIMCDGSWTITNESDWCTTDVTSGTGNSTVTVSMQSYGELEDRNMNLTVKAGDKTQVLGVTQKGKEAIILSKDKFDLPPAGGVVAVNVKSNVSYYVMRTGEAWSWIAALMEKTRANVSDTTYYFMVSENKSDESRMGYIVFSTASLQDTVRIYQAQNDRLVLTQTEYKLSAKDTTIAVELKFNVDYEVGILGDAASWIRQVETRACRVDRLVFHIDENTGEVPRTAKIVVRDKNDVLSDTVYISQAAVEVPDVPGVEEQDISAEFDPEFAKVLQEKGYISDVSHITLTDVNKIKVLYISNKGLTSLKGIEYFESLTTLGCDNNQLTSLDVSKCTFLESLSCVGNQLASLDISENLELRYLNFWGNPGDEKGFFSLRLWDNYENTIDRISEWNYDDKTIHIRILNEEYCKDITADFDPDFAKRLEEKGYLPDASHIIIGDVKLQSYLNVREAELVSLKGIEYFESLIRLYCDDNQLTSLDVSKNVALDQLYCNNNQLTFLDVSKNVVLRYLSCSNNQLTSLDVSKCTVLEELSCSVNQLASLDISQNPALTTLDFFYNPGDRESLFPVTAWFDNSTIPENLSIVGNSWKYDGKTITVDFRKAE